MKGHWKCIGPQHRTLRKTTWKSESVEIESKFLFFVRKSPATAHFAAMCLMCVRAFTVQFQLQWQAPCNCNHKPNLPHALYTHKAQSFHTYPLNHGEVQWMGALDVDTSSGWKQKKMPCGRTTLAKIALSVPLQRVAKQSCKGRNKAAACASITHLIRSRTATVRPQWRRATKGNTPLTTVDMVA